MALPPDVADVLFMHELALELGMTVSELGQRMSNYELTVSWPLFFEWRSRESARQAARADK